MHWYVIYIQRVEESPMKSLGSKTLYRSRLTPIRLLAFIVHTPLMLSPSLCSPARLLGASAISNGDWFFFKFYFKLPA